MEGYVLAEDPAGNPVLRAYLVPVVMVLPTQVFSLDRSSTWTLVPLLSSVTMPANIMGSIRMAEYPFRIIP